MKRKKLRDIDWKRGSGSTYLGIVVMLVAFTAIVVSININRLYLMSVRSQVVVDAIVDGASVAGNSDMGFDELAMQSAAQDLVNYNPIPGATIDYNIDVEDEYDIYGYPTGNKRVEGMLSVTEDYFIPKYLDFADRFQTSMSAVVQVTIQSSADGWIQSSYYHNTTAILPFYTTTEGNRNPAYISWFINNYLNPENNTIYQGTLTETHGHEFLYDYLKCMNLDNNPPQTLTEWQNFVTIFSRGQGWEEYSYYDTEAIQRAADEGKAVVITQHTTEGEILVYVVVPQTTILQDGCVATATVGAVNWNYQLTNLADLAADSLSLTVIVHD